MTTTTPPPYDPAAAAATSTRPGPDPRGGTPRTPPPGGPDPSADAARAAAEAKAAFDEVRATAKSTVAKVADRLGEIRDYAGYYAETKVDALKVKATTYAVYAALGVVGAVVGLAALATAGVLLVSGISHALSALFNSVWLGELVTAVGLLALLGVGAVIGLKVLTGSTKRKLMAKYEQRHQDQRAKFGADVLQRSQEANG